MKYKLKGNFSHDPDRALIEILENRGVKDTYDFCNPSPECELDPYGLDNIEAAAERLLYHLRKDSKILFVVD